MKKNGHELLKGNSLAMGTCIRKLLEKTLKASSILRFCCVCTQKFIYTYIGAHRALPDVPAMEAVLTNPLMVNCLFQLQINSPQKQLKKWVEQKRAHNRKMVLTKGLGNCVTLAQATQLDSLGIALEDLVQLRNSTDREGFLTSLREKVIRSRALRDKLQATVLRLP